MGTVHSFSIFHTSDEHGHIGNAAAIQKLVDDARGANAAGTLLISCGDTFEGSATSSLIGSEPSREVLASAKYDAITLGDHDFDRGSDVARKWINETSCPVLSANIENAEDGSPLANTRPSQVFERNGVKIGLIGVTTPDTPSLGYGDSLRDLRFTDPIAAVRTQAEALRAEGASVVGVLSHLGLTADCVLAQTVPGLDFILGGHSHDEMIDTEIVNGTVIGHSGAFRHAVGWLDLQVDAESKQLASVAYHAIPIDAKAARPDNPVAAIVRKYEALMEVHLKVPVGVLSHGYSHDDHAPDELEGLVTQAMARASGADVAMINQKFNRAPLPAGVIQRRELMASMPFDNRVQTLELPVSEVARLIAESERRGNADETRLAYGGVRLETAADGTPRLYHGLIELADEVKLKVATTDFLLSGGLGYFQSDLRDKALDHGLVRDAVEKSLTAPAS